MSESRENELKEAISSLLEWGCCLHEPQFQPDEITRVVAWAWTEYGSDWKPAPKEGSDSESVALVELADGSYGVFSESEDYTGHGCQCSSSTSRHATVESAFEQGLTADEGAVVRRFMEATP